MIQKVGGFIPAFLCFFIFLFEFGIIILYELQVFHAEGCILILPLQFGVGERATQPGLGLGNNEQVWFQFERCFRKYKDDIHAFAFDVFAGKHLDLLARAPRPHIKRRLQRQPRVIVHVLGEFDNMVDSIFVLGGDLVYILQRTFDIAVKDGRR